MHWNSVGTLFPQTLSNKLRDSGMLRLMPSTLAFRAVHRQTAASRSTRPWMREQQGSVGGEPTFAFTNPSTLAQTPSFSASLGHVPAGEEGVVGVVGFGVGFAFEGGGGQGTLWVAVANAKNTRLRERKRAAAEAEFVEAISNNDLWCLVWLN